MMQRIGRRLGLMGGNALAIVGGLVAAAALFADSFWLFTFALLLVGAATAFLQQYRFAAAEAVMPNMRGIAISRVMIGGIITASGGATDRRLHARLVRPAALSPGLSLLWRA